MIAIQTPIILDDVLKQISLKYDPISILQSSAQRSLETEKDAENVISGIIPPAPTIIVRKPLWWHLTPQIQQFSRNTSDKELANFLASQLKEHHFYLAMVACVFMPEIDCPITYAALTCHLKPNSGRKPPVTLDLYPQVIDHAETVSKSHKIIVTPQLRFQPFTNSSMAVAVIESKNLIPLIRSNHENSSNPFWEYLCFEGKPIIDYRFGYLLISKPKEVKSITLAIEITAHVQTSYGELKAIVKEKDRLALQQDICLEYIKIL